ncbi:hypothetical protein HMPREF9073_00697 [Capnocytophaga sp. oral taxon 326 str. F0382]|nr:hypothetical protein HMPREF9073_00697 [Capnocytophaga sp. oral taxon 326 str. F0382]
MFKKNSSVMLSVCKTIVTFIKKIYFCESFYVFSEQKYSFQL